MEGIPNDDSKRFTCPNCGSHEVQYEWFYSLTTYYTDTLECTCEDSNVELAAERHYHTYTTYRVLDHGEYNEFGRWEREETLDEEEIETEEIEDECHEYCSDCVSSAPRGAWETEIEPFDESHKEYGEEETYSCANCGQEIE